MKRAFCGINNTGGRHLKTPEGMQGVLHNQCRVESVTARSSSAKVHGSMNGQTRKLQAGGVCDDDHERGSAGKAASSVRQKSEKSMQ